MKFIMRQFLMVLALAVAASPVMAKDNTKTVKKSKLKSGLFSKKSSSSVKKIKRAPSKRKAVGSAPSGKAEYKNITVNINKASASALSAYLVGIGPVKAQAIVDYRRENGKFSSLKDLMNVSGVGEETYKGLKRNISTSRGETRAPTGYKMGDTSGKSSRKSKTGSSKSVRSTSKGTLGTSKKRSGSSGTMKRSGSSSSTKMKKSSSKLKKSSSSASSSKKKKLKPKKKVKTKAKLKDKKKKKKSKKKS